MSTWDRFVQGCRLGRQDSTRRSGGGPHPGSHGRLGVAAAALLVVVACVAAVLAPPAAADPPTTPTNVTAVAGEHQVTVSWTPPLVDGGSPITYYELSDVSGHIYECASRPTPTSCVIKNLVDGQAYTFSVTASNANSSSQPSPAIRATPVDKGAPGTPTGLTATPGDGQASLSWTVPSAGSSAITGYNIYESTSPGGEHYTPVNTTPVVGPSYLATGLPNGTTYYFVVTAVNAAGESLRSTEVSSFTTGPQTPPGPPTDLRAGIGGYNEVPLQWTAPTYVGGSPIIGYNVYVDRSGTPVNSTPITSTSYDVTGLAYRDSIFSFVVRAVNKGGVSAASNETYAFLEATYSYAPTGLTGVPGDGQVSLSWTAPTFDGGSPIVSYSVLDEPDTSPKQGQARYYDCPFSPATSCVVTGLTNGTPYRFTVSARNGAQFLSGDSNVIIVTPNAAGAPGAPTGLTASTVPGHVPSQVSLSWTPPAAPGGSPITGYNIYEGTSPSDETLTPLNPSPVVGTSYAISSFDTYGGSYYFFVQAVNRTGGSQPSNEVTVTSPSTPPDTPSQLKATAGDGRVSLSWTGVTFGGGAFLNGYYIYEGTSAGGESSTPLNAVPVLPRSYTVTGLQNHTTYYFVVRSSNTGNAVSAPSNEVSAVPAAVPGAPTIASVTAGDAQASVAFTAPASDGGSTITGYTVTAHDSTTPSNGGQTASGTSSPITVTGLTNGDSYTFTVTATNGMGAGPVSGTSTAVTPATVPAVPGIGAVTAGVGQVSVAFTASTSTGGAAITAYTVTAHDSTTPANGGQTASGTSSPIPVTGLTIGDSYTFTVVATNRIGSSESSTASAPATPLPPDTTPPTLTVPSQVDVSATSSAGAVAVTYTVTATDDRDPHPTVTCDPASGSNFPLGTTPVTCTATDNVGNRATGSFTVVVRDRTGPVLTVPSDEPYVGTTDPDGVAVTYSVSAKDAIDGPVTPTCTPASGSKFPVGATTVHCSATDAAGNTSTGSFVVLVVDAAPPVVTVPQPITAEATSSRGAAVDFTVTATDAVDGPEPVVCAIDITVDGATLVTSGDTFPLGSTLVTCEARDKAFNTGLNTFTIDVVDTTGPALTLPADQHVASSGAAGATVSYTATATDAVDGEVSPSCTPASGTVFAEGVTTVHCSASDAAGNRSTGSFVVTVGTTGAPVVTVPKTITAEAAGAHGAAVTFSVSATDTVDGSRPVTCTVDGDTVHSGDTFALGTSTVLCSATDTAGNTGSGSFTVHVVDTTAPTLTLPADQHLHATNADGVKATYTATAVDAVDGTVTPSCTPASGTTFALGSTTVDCSATDAAGNSSAGSFTVDVTLADTTAPVVTVPASITAEATSSHGAPVAFAVSATDAVDGSRPVTCTVDGVTVHSGDTFALGSTSVVCTATDTDANTGSASFTVRVTDTTAPTVTVPTATVSTEATGPTGAVVTFTATAKDLVDGDLTPTCSQASGSRFPIGSSTVTCTARDADGNTGTATFSVEVTDTTAPVIHLPDGADTTVDAASPSGAKVTYTVTAQDPVHGQVPVTCAPVSGSTFPVGTTTVTCTATDPTPLPAAQRRAAAVERAAAAAAPLTSTATFVITVRPYAAPPASTAPSGAPTSSNPTHGNPGGGNPSVSSGPTGTSSAPSATSSSGADGLASTGLDIAGLLALAIGLLGTGLLLARRNRRARPNHRA